MAIKLVEGTNFGIDISNCSNQEWEVFQKEFIEKESSIRCLICNSNTAKRFRLGLFCNNIITINNKVPDETVYINHVR